MDSLTIAGIVLGCTFGGTLLGLLLQYVLPSDHLHAESKDVIKLGTGLIATMAALVLGLLIGAAKNAFDAQAAAFERLATNIVLVDRALAHYGPDAQGAREQLRHTVATVIEHVWPDQGPRIEGLAIATISTEGQALYQALSGLQPHNPEQRDAQTQAMQINADMSRTRWQLNQWDDGSLPLPFLIVLVFWLFILFLSFGLFSPRNGTVVAALFVCALSVAGAAFLIVDLDQPFEGLIQTSNAPLRHALAQLGQ